ncbi:MAG TPA: PKD domain-containing protein, partial [Firmicutes bacterium]|nr:PKD domain-containing protein [Bacillota bacterium]
MTGRHIETGKEISNRYIWSFVNVFVDPAEMHWNALKWLEHGPCANCVAITKIEPSGTGTTLVDVEITHPFTLANLTGFDVRGIAMFAGTHEFPESGLITSNRESGEGELVNADGFTALYNPQTAGCGPNGLQGYIKGKFGTATWPDSTLNGYRRFVSDDPANTRNAFYAISKIKRTYEIKMPSGPFVFGYAVDANWAPPIQKPVYNPMEDFPPEANCPEAWKVDVTVKPVGLGLNEKGGSAILSIDVYDWQGKSTILPPRIECPEIFNGTVTALWKADGAGFTRYEAVVLNMKKAGIGRYKCLVAVEDSENAAAPDWLDLTAYQVVHLEVVKFQDIPPVALADFSPKPQIANEPVHLFDNGSYDPDGGGIVLYQWDIDVNGIYEYTGPEAHHTWDVPGTYHVQLKVTDDEGTSAFLAKPLEIEIVETFPMAGWARTWGGEKEVISHSVAVDKFGNAYVTGEFRGTVDLDPGVGVSEHTAVSDLQDVFLIKLNSMGIFQWGRTWGGTGYDQGFSVAVSSSGNVFVAGRFSDKVDFDPGSGVDEHVSNGYPDVFLCMYDSSGNYKG